MNNQQATTSSPSRIQSFTDLYAWQHAHSLALEIYKLTSGFPKDQQFNLMSQMQRAIISVGSNIAEGFGRYSSIDQTHFFYQALSSLRELHSQLLLARDLEYIVDRDAQRTLNNITITSKLLNGLIKSSKTEKYKAATEDCRP